MAMNFKTFWEGIKVKAKTALTGDSKGDLEVLNSDGKLYYHNGTTSSPVVTESHTATLTNKTLVSPVINTGVSGTAIDTDATLATASNTKVPSALAVKTYVDSSSGSVQADVDDLITLSGVPANSEDLGVFTGNIIPDGSTVKEALQELESFAETDSGLLSAHIADPTDAHDASAISVAAIPNLTATDGQAAFAEHQDDIDDLVALSGVAANAVNLGTFTGTTIPDSSTNKQALQALETGLETHVADTSAHGTTGDVVGTSDSQTLTNKTLDGDLNTIQDLGLTSLKTVLADASKFLVRDASGIVVSNTKDVPTGTVVGTTDSQVLTNKTIDADLSTITNIENADIKALAAIDATKIADGSVSSTEFQYINTLSSNAQTQIDTKAAGAASSTDNHLVRFDGTTGKVLQDGSTAVLSDAGALTGLTQLVTDNVTIDGDSITDGTSVINLASNDVNITGENIHSAGAISYDRLNDGTTTGAAAIVDAGFNKTVVLTNISLTSVGGIDNPIDGQEVTLSNGTGASITILNNNGPAGGDGIVTGTGSDLTLASESSISLVYNSTLSRWYVIGGTGSGSAVGSLDTFINLYGSEDIGEWATGDNATFLGGGTLAGTFVKETSTPLNGTDSYKYTQAAGSANDYVASPTQSVPLRFRGNQVSVVFPYTYNGNNSDITLVVYDDTNNTVISSNTLNALPATPTTGSIYKANFTIPSTCTQLIVGFQTLVENSGKILNFDDIQVSADTTKYSNPSTVTEWESYTPTFTGFGTASSIQFQWRRVGGGVEVRGKFTSGTSTAVEARITLPNSYTSAGTTLIPSIQICGNGTRSTTDAGSFHPLIEPAVTYMTIGRSNAANNGLAKVTGSSLLASGDSFTLISFVPIAGLSASNPQIISASESFSTDTASLVYASSSQYTPSTLPDAPVGTFITHTYAALGNTATQTTTAPTQTTSDMNINGVLLTGRAVSATSNSTTPCRFDIQIGKGFKGKELFGFASTSKNDPISYDYRPGSTTLAIQSGTDWGYDPDTGVFTINAGTDATTLSTTRNVGVRPDTAAAQTSGYFVINASKSPALVGIPQVQPRFATLSDQKASGTAGGTFTSGAYQTRTLQTLVDDTGIVTSLASNQFVLSAGTYYIDAWALGHRVGTHKAKIRNITDSTDALIGGVTTIGTATDLSNISPVKGTITITAAKTFELQHRCSSTFATEGFGRAATFGDVEIYSTVKITKVK